MRATILLAAAIGLTTLLPSRASLALDQTMGAGVASRGRPAHVYAGSGIPTDQGLARPGFSSKIGHGSVGVSKAGSGGSAGPSTNNSFHAAGIGKVVQAGKGQNTMDTVPGRSPTYSKILSGKRGEPMMGSRGH